MAYTSIMLLLHPGPQPGSAYLLSRNSLRDNDLKIPLHLEHLDGQSRPRGTIGLHIFKSTGDGPRSSPKLSRCFELNVSAHLQRHVVHERYVSLFLPSCRYHIIMNESCDAYRGHEKWIRSAVSTLIYCQEYPRPHWQMCNRPFFAFSWDFYTEITVSGESIWCNLCLRPARQGQLDSPRCAEHVNLFFEPCACLSNSQGAGT